MIDRPIYAIQSTVSFGMGAVPPALNKGVPPGIYKILGPPSFGKFQILQPPRKNWGGAHYADITIIKSVINCQLNIVQHTPSSLNSISSTPINHRSCLVTSANQRATAHVSREGNQHFN